MTMTQQTLNKKLEDLFYLMTEKMFNENGQPIMPINNKHLKFVKACLNTQVSALEIYQENLQIVDSKEESIRIVKTDEMQKDDIIIVTELQIVDIIIDIVKSNNSKGSKVSEQQRKFVETVSNYVSAKHEQLEEFDYQIIRK